MMTPQQEALRKAVIGGDIPAITAALAAGAEINYSERPPLADALRYFVEYPPLSDEQRFAVVRFLVEHGADVNLPDDLGCRPLLQAAFEWNDVIFAYLLSRGADPDFQIDHDPETLFDSVIFDWRQDFFDLDEPEWLLEGEDDVEWLSRFAAKYGKPQPRILQLLKATGAKHYHELRR